MALVPLNDNGDVPSTFWRLEHILDEAILEWLREAKKHDAFSVSDTSNCLSIRIVLGGVTFVAGRVSDGDGRIGGGSFFEFRQVLRF